MREIEGERKTGGKRFCVVAARFNSWLTERLLKGAVGELKRLGAAEGEIDVVRVPGSFELPVAAKKAAASGRYAAVVCLGAVLKGETSHDVQIASSCAAGIQEAALATGVPVAFGVITADTFELARARASLDGGRNLGADAASAAVEMASLLQRVGE